MTMSWTRVKNVNGSGRYLPPYGYASWLDYWEKQTGKKLNVCGASGCNGTDPVGAHVQKANSYDNRWYVTPLCKTCNNRTDEFDVYFDLVPVPSNL